MSVSLSGGKNKGLQVVIWLFLYLFGPATIWAASLSFNGDISHRNTDGEESTSFSQSTSLSLDQELTTLMRLNENIRYSSNYQNGSRRESLTPSIDLNINNEFFNFNLSGTAHRSMGSEQVTRTSKSWDARFAGNWQKKFWPAVQLRYGQDFSSDEEDPPQTDTVSDQAGLTLDWDLLLANLYYSLDRSESEDRLGGSENRTTRQLVRLNTGTSFLDNRLGVNFSQNYSRSKREHAATISTEGIALIPVSLIETRGGWPLDLSDNPDYAEEPDWEDLSAVLPEPVVDERYNIALQLNERRVDTIHLFTSTDISDEAEANLFTWDIYSSEDGEIWTLEESNLAYTYDSNQQRFEIEFADLSARYLMLVENSFPLLSESTAFTSVDTLRQESGIVGERIVDDSLSESYQTNVSLRWQIRPAINFNYNINLRINQESDASDNEKFSHSAGLGWRPSTRVNTNLSASETRDKPDDANETKTRSYGLNISYTPIPTLQFNLGGTRSENYEADRRKFLSHAYHLYTTARIYPDLSSSLDLIYSTSDNTEKDTESNNFNARWNISARLLPDLTVNLTEAYRLSENNGEKSDSYASSGNLSWRPSAMFSFRAGAAKTWREEGDSPLTYNASASLAATPKTQFNMAYSHSGTSDSYTLNWNWIINEIFSFNANSSYLDAEEDDIFSYGVRLNFRY